MKLAPSFRVGNGKLNSVYKLFERVGNTDSCWKSLWGVKNNVYILWSNLLIYKNCLVK